MLSNVKYRNDMFTMNTRLKPSFLVGVTLEFPIKTNMAINTALNYKWVGASFNDSTDLHAFRLGYANLDFTFNYIFDMVSGAKPYVEGGGFLAYLVNASSVELQENSDQLIREDLKIGTAETDDIIPMDAGFTIGGGVYFKNWKFGLGYQESFINLSPQDGLYLWNKMGYLKVTYFIGENARR